MQSATSPSARPYQILSNSANLAECPNAIPLGKSANITRGDLHGNSVMLMHQLRLHGVIYAPNPDMKIKGLLPELEGIVDRYTDTKMDSVYNELVTVIEQLELGAIQKREAQNPEEKTTKEQYDKFKQLISRLACDPNAIGLLRSIGDMLADRRGNDVLTLLFFGLLKQFNIPYKIVYSNHDSSFLGGWMGSDIYLMPSEEKEKKNSDATHLRLYKKDTELFAYYIEGKEHTLESPKNFDLFKIPNLNPNGVLNNSLTYEQQLPFDILLYQTQTRGHTVASRGDSSLGASQAASFYAMRKLITKGIIKQKEFDDLVKEVYLPHLKLIDYEIDEKTQPPTLFLFTHAPVGLETYKELAKEFKVPYPSEPMTMDALCKMIDGINTQFTERLKTDEGIIDLVKKSWPDNDFNPSLSKPLARITWNRNAEYYEPDSWTEKQLELPTMVSPGIAGAFKVCVIHGHVGSADLSHVFSNFINVDSEFGKRALKDIGTLVTLVTHPTRQPLELTATAAAAKHAPTTATLAAAAAVQPIPAKTPASKLARSKAFEEALKEANLEEVKLLINSNPALLHGRYGLFDSPPLVMAMALGVEALRKENPDQAEKFYKLADMLSKERTIEVNAQDKAGNTALHRVCFDLNYRKEKGGYATPPKKFKDTIKEIAERLLSHPDIDVDKANFKEPNPEIVFEFAKKQELSLNKIVPGLVAKIKTKHEETLAAKTTTGLAGKTTTPTAPIVQPEPAKTPAVQSEPVKASAVQPAPVKTPVAELSIHDTFAKAIEEGKVEEVKKMIDFHNGLLSERYGAFNSPPLVMVVTLAGEAIARNEIDKATKLYQIAEQYFDHPRVDYNAQDSKGNTLLHGALNLLTYRNVGGQELGVKTLKLFHAGPSKVSIDIPNNDGVTARDYIKTNQVRLNLGRLQGLGAILFKTSERAFPLLAPTAEAKQPVQPQPSNAALSKLYATLENRPPKIEEAKKLLMDDKSLINARDETGQTPLIRIINILSRFPEPEYGDDGELTPESLQLDDAKFQLQNFRNELLKNRNNNGIKVDLTDNSSETALHHAVRKNDLVFIRNLLECRADFKIKNNDGVSPFKLMIQLIEENKIDKKMLLTMLNQIVPNIPSRAIYTPPPLPVVSAKAEQLLKEDEAWLLKCFPEAQASGQNEKMDYRDMNVILDHNPSLVNIQNAKKETPLIASVKAMQQAVRNDKKDEIKKHAELINDIINRPGLNIDLTDEEGHTALYYLSLINYVESSNLILKFLERGANPTLGEQTDTPLDRIANASLTLEDTSSPILLDVAKFYEELLMKLNLNVTPVMSTSPHSFMAQKAPPEAGSNDQQPATFASKGLGGGQ